MGALNHALDPSYARQLHFEVLAMGAYAKQDREEALRAFLRNGKPEFMDILA
jgi:hypothetical protein